MFYQQLCSSILTTHGVKGVFELDNITIGHSDICTSWPLLHVSYCFQVAFSVFMPLKLLNTFSQNASVAGSILLIGVCDAIIHASAL